jgi:hypothetical protein
MTDNIGAALPDPQTVARALGGEINGGQVRAPGHSAKNRSLSVRIDANALDGFVVHGLCGDDPVVCRDHVRDGLNLLALAVAVVARCWRTLTDDEVIRISARGLRHLMPTGRFEDAS